MIGSVIIVLSMVAFAACMAAYVFGWCGIEAADAFCRHAIVLYIMGIFAAIVEALL